GRILVAALAYTSFVLMLLLSFLSLRRPEFSIGRMPPPGFSPRSFEVVQHALFNLFFNSAILFGLVIIFVLLLVGALVAEQRSRQELTEANSRLRRYALLIENQATLQERSRIAREIHDSVGHFLTAQSIQLENVALFLAGDRQRAAKYLQKARELGKEALTNVRHSVAKLRTNPLQGKSLNLALQQLLEEFRRTTGIAVVIQISLNSVDKEEVAIALYRVVQEALTNIAKHSKATSVNLHLTETKHRISLRLSDNGQGFDTRQHTVGFGLQGMRERTEALGGNYLLQSQPGKGCTIQVDVPVLN
ncbi:MAG: sensor histidine kinase, partial [Okeania sp. SIO2D1]|nr:sensor histidine kinase [Okeania sp. SIO2D1]